MEPCYGDKASGIGGGWSSPAGDIGYLEIWEAEAKSSAEKNLLKIRYVLQSMKSIAVALSFYMKSR